MTEEEKKQQKELWKQDRIRERREEWQKIRKLGFTARIGYLWDYYKIVLVIAAVLIFVIYLIFNVIQGVRTNTLLYACFLNCNELDPDSERLREDYINSRGGIKKMQEITFDTSIYVDPDSPGISQRDVANTIKITSFVGAGAVDVFLAPPDVTKFEQEGAMLLALDELLTKEETERLRKAGCLYYAKEPDPVKPDQLLTEPESGSGTDEQTGQREAEAALNTVPEEGMHIYAVRVDQAGVLGQYTIYDEGRQIWFSIIGNSRRTEETVRFLHFLLGETTQE